MPRSTFMSASPSNIPSVTSQDLDIDEIVPNERNPLTCPPKTGPPIMRVLDGEAPPGGPDADESVFGGADRRDLEGARGRVRHGRAVPAARREPADVLPLAAEVRRP